MYTHTKVAQLVAYVNSMLLGFTGCGLSFVFDIVLSVVMVHCGNQSYSAWSANRQWLLLALFAPSRRSRRYHTRALENSRDTDQYGSASTVPAHMEVRKGSGRLERGRDHITLQGERLKNYL